MTLSRRKLLQTVAAFPLAATLPRMAKAELSFGDAALTTVYDERARAALAARWRVTPGCDVGAQTVTPAALAPAPPEAPLDTCKRLVQEQMSEEATLDLLDTIGGKLLVGVRAAPPPPP